MAPTNTTRTLTADETRLYDSDTAEAAAFRRRVYQDAQAHGLTEIYSADGIMLDAVEPAKYWSGWDATDGIRCIYCGSETHTYADHH